MRCIPFSVNFSNCRIYIVGVSNLEKNLRVRKMHFSSDIEQQFHLRSSVPIEKIKKSPWMSINLIYNVEIGKEHALKKILKNQFMEVKKVQHIFFGCNHCPYHYLNSMNLNDLQLSVLPFSQFNREIESKIIIKMKQRCRLSS